MLTRLADLEHARDFLYSALILMVLTVMLGIATAAYSPRDPARSHLAALVLAYAVLPFALALPLAEALPDTTLVNAWFEMMSAFTTTGASVYLPDRLADSVHRQRRSSFCRSLCASAHFRNTGVPESH